MKCRDCKGKKTYRGAGMYAPEACHRCRGSGEEPVDGGELAKQLLEQEARDKAKVREYGHKEGDFPRPRPASKTLQEAYGGDVDIKLSNSAPPRIGGDIKLAPSGMPPGNIRLRGGYIDALVCTPRGGVVRLPGQVTHGLTDHQRAEVQEMIREGADPLKRQIGALQQELARLREPRSRPEEQVISNVMEVEPGATCRIPLQPMNGGCESYELQRMLVSAMPVDLVDTNGENIELPVIIECRGTMSRFVPILFADVVSTAGLLEVSGPIGVRCDQELTVQVNNPTTQKVLVTATVWVVERKPQPPTRFPDRCHG